MRTRVFDVLIFAMLCALGSVAEGADYYVDIDDSFASDANRGSRGRPWPSIARAARAVKAGDVVHVMPGRYPETIVMDGAENVTFVADGDGPAVIDGAETVAPWDFAPTDTKGVFRWKAPARLTRRGHNRPARPLAWVFYDNEWLNIKNAAKDGPLSSDDRMTFARYDDGVTVNFDGASVPDNVPLAVSCRADGFVLTNASGVTIKGFVFNRQAGDVIHLKGCTGCTVEDCHVIQPNMHALHTPGSQSCTFRRVRIYNANMWSTNLKGQGHLIEECVLQTCGRKTDPAGEPWVGTLKFNGGSHITVRHNLVADRVPKVTRLAGVDVRAKPESSGVWGDIWCVDDRIYGNSIARIGHAGIYLEYTQKRNTVMYNVVQDCGMGITMRQGSGNVVRNNWIVDTAMLWGMDVDTDGMAGMADWRARDGRTPPWDHTYWGREVLDGICLWHTFLAESSRDNIVMDNLVQVSGRSVSIPMPTDLDPKQLADAARVMCTDPSKIQGAVAAKVDYRTVKGAYRTPFANIVDRNLYVRDPARQTAGFALYQDRQIDAFEEYRDAVAFDEHSRCGDYGPEDVGMRICWTMPPGARVADRPVGFDYDGGAERASPLSPARFGRGVWMDGPPEPYAWYKAAGASLDSGPHYPPVKKRSKAKRDPRRWVGWPLCRSGVRALATVNDGAPSEIAREGLGWRSVSVPVTPGTVMHASLYLKAADVRPQGDEGAVRACVVFNDWTGHDVQRSWLVGPGARDDLARGSYDWTCVLCEVRVPQRARRMCVYAGMLPASGTLLIDDMRMCLVDVPRGR